MSYQPLRPARHQIVRVRGLAHRVVCWGPPGAVPIVLLHGWMDAAETFQFLVDALPQDLAFAAPDWRGFGRSEWPAEGYVFADYLADLEALLEVLAPGARPGIIGHSMGGNIASLYAGVRPGRLAWLVNLEGFGLPRTDPADAPARYARWLDELGTEPAARRYLEPMELARSLCARNPRLPPERAGFIARAWLKAQDGGFVLAADPRHRRVNPVLYRREEAEACWRRIAVPTLLVLGGLSEFRDRLGPDGTDAAFEALIPGLRIATLAGLGHMLHHEDPAAVAAVLEPFIAAHCA